MAAKPRQSAARKVSAETVKQAIGNRWNPIRGLTPENLMRMAEQWEAGYLAEFAVACEAIETRDDKVKGCKLKRQKAIARYGWEIVTQGVDEGDQAMEALADEQVKALNFFYSNLTATSVLEQDLRGGFTTLIKQMAAAISQRYAVHEIVWEKRNRYYTATFWHCPLHFFERTMGKLRFLSTLTQTYGEDMPDADWLVSVGDGIGIAVAFCWVLKRYPLRAWMQFTQKFGIPNLHGKTDAAVGSKEWNTMVAMVRDFYNSGAVVTNQGQSIESIETKMTGTSVPMVPLVEWADRAIATLWRGSDLSTMSKGGDAVGSSVQASETELLELDDAIWVTEILNTRIDRQVIANMFGPDAPVLAAVVVKTQQKQNTDQELKIDDFAIRNGFPLSKQGFADRYKRPLPPPEEELLTAPAPMTAPGELPTDPAKQPPELGKPKPVPAQNQAKPRTLTQESIARAYEVAPEWLDPALDVFADLERRATERGADGLPVLSDTELLDLMEQASARVPELLGQMDINALAEALEAASGTAALQGAVSGLRKRKETGV